ncbi:MAG: radical SAM protein [Halieaceae bacterium]|nr:radical SAM protein [Halieaceae bacterium]
MPFCQSRCLSCDHITTVTHDGTVIDHYLDDLEHELEMVAERVGSGLDLAQLYIGGGTPNYLSDPQLLRLADMLEQHFRFADTTDTTIEISPRRSSAAQLQMLRGVGFRALKLEVRDLDPEVQKALAKSNSMPVLEDVFHNARDVGFETISMDLLYGLPTQTMASIRDTVQGILELEPDRLNCYAYARQPEMFRHQRAIQSPSLPSLADRLIMFNSIVDTMEDAGYTWVGLDSFAREGDALVVAQEEKRLAHNWMGYNTHGSQTLLGFGASAISEVAGACVQNHHGIDAWSESLQQDSFPVRAGVQLSERGMQHRRAVNGLLSNMHLDGGFEPGEGEESVQALETLREQGYLQVDDSRVSVTPEGRYLLHHLAGNSALDLKWSNGW